MFQLRKCTTNQLIKEISRRAEEMCPPELIKPTYPNYLKINTSLMPKISRVY